MQKALVSVDAHRGDLERERGNLLQQTEGQRRYLQELAEPDLTDLDIELILSLPNGNAKIGNTLTGATERWSRARDHVISLWKDYQEAQSHVGKARHAQKQLRDFESIHAEQQRVLEKFKRRHAEVRQVRETVDRQ